MNDSVTTGVFFLCVFVLCVVFSYCVLCDMCFVLCVICFVLSGQISKHFWMRIFLDVRSEEEILLLGPLDLRI